MTTCVPSGFGLLKQHAGCDSVKGLNRTQYPARSHPLAQPPLLHRLPSPYPVRRHRSVAAPTCPLVAVSSTAVALPLPGIFLTGAATPSFPLPHFPRSIPPPRAAPAPVLVIAILQLPPTTTVANLTHTLRPPPPTRHYPSRPPSLLQSPATRCRRRLSVVAQPDSPLHPHPTLPACTTTLTLSPRQTDPMRPTLATRHRHRRRPAVIAAGGPLP